MTMAERGAARRALATAAFVFLVVAAVGAAFVRLVENRRLDAKYQAATQRVTARALALTRQVEGVVAIARQTAAVIKQSGRGNFREVASDALAASPAAFGLALAEAGVIREVSPAALSREKGLLITTEPTRGPDVVRAVDSGKPVVGTPLARTAEGTMLHIYVPLEGVENSMVVGYARIDDLTRLAEVDQLRDAGYNYRLSWLEPVTARKITFIRSSEVELISPRSVVIELPGSRWLLELTPREGWTSRPDVLRSASIAFIVALLAALFVNDILRRPEVLEREVETRTRKLVEANRRIVTEVEHRVHAEELAKHEATHDNLTGLPNRAYLIDKLGRSLERAQRVPTFRFAVLFLDLDRFTSLNDSFGNHAGDQLLRDVAARLEGCLRLGDMVGRVGGDEFVLVVFDVEEITDVIRVARRCHDALGLPFTIDEQPVFTSVSVGISVSTTGYEKPNDMIRDANLAMDRARQQGGARDVLFDPQMHASALAMMQIERELRRALENNELRAFYQPIVSIATGGITGFEALIRWEHPERGFISPAAFLPAAVASGLIVPVDQWIMREAARQLGQWQSSSTSLSQLSVSINVSGKRLTDPHLVEEVREILSVNPIDPKTLRLEITEGEMMENTDQAIAILHQLKALGITLMVDDFGTGYSSLSYLQRFPVDIVKIDQSFVKGMTTNPKDEEIVRAILNLAQILGLRVVAEGIETAEHLARLRQLGCSHGQGYFFSRPLPAAAAQVLLETQPRFG